MTPIAMKLLKRDPLWSERFAKTKFFDINDLEDIVQELHEKRIREIERTGELPEFEPVPLMPAEKVWLEFRAAKSMTGNGTERPIGLYLEQMHADHIECIPMNVGWTNQDDEPDDYGFSFEPGTDRGQSHQITARAHADPERARILDALAIVARLSLELLVDWRSVIDFEIRERGTKQFNRAMRAAGQRDFMVSLAKCSINMGQHGPAADPGDGAQRNLPLHFVRGHKRRLSSGNSTFVNPHWRGSAEFGVGLKSYQVNDARGT